jgi:hypothetical protein
MAQIRRIKITIACEKRNVPTLAQGNKNLLVRQALPAAINPNLLRRNSRRL